MNQLLIFVLTVSSHLIGSVLPYPTYVPTGACVSMIPGHGGSAQNSVAPYKVEVSPRIVRRGDIVQVVLSGDRPFQGFYLQGRTPEGIPVGTFIRSDIVKTHNCNGEGNAAFHGVRGPKNDLEIFWKAPKDYQGQVTFTATFVEEFDTFWTFVRGNPITVKIDDEKGSLQELATGNEDGFKNKSVEIVPRILNREPEVADSESRRLYHSLFNKQIPTPNYGPIRQDYSQPLPNYPEFHSDSEGFVPSLGGFGGSSRRRIKNSRAAHRYPIKNLGENSNFHFSSHQPEQSPLFPKMEINSNNWGMNYKNQKRHYYENKINSQHQQQSLSPYKFEYNGNPYESNLNTFSTPSSYYANRGSGSSSKTLTPATSHRGHRMNTVWVMDNRFQNFKDVDELIPTQHHHVPMSKGPKSHLPHHQHQHPMVVQISPISQSQPSNYNLGGSASGYHHHHPSNDYSHFPSSFQPSPADPGHAHHHHKLPTHGYLVHNPKSVGHDEPPFYLIPASKHDVDNVRGQYFNNPFTHHLG